MTKYFLPLFFAAFCGITAAAEPEPNPHAGPPTTTIRIGDNQIGWFTLNLSQSQLHKDPNSICSTIEFAILDHSGQVAAGIEKCKALGIHAYPGVYLNPSSNEQWVDRAYWQQKADNLKRLCDLRPAGESRVMVDFENYKTGDEATYANIARLGGLAKLESAMEPWRAVIKDKGVVPCCHPASTVDAAIEMTIKAAGGKGELQDEYTFPASWYWRICDRDTLVAMIRSSALNRLALQAKYPQATFVPGWFDEYLRDFNKGYRAEWEASFGEPRRWIFLWDRTDEPKWGSVDWVTGRSRHSLNDLTCYFPLRRDLRNPKEYDFRPLVGSIAFTLLPQTSGNPTQPARDSVMDGPLWTQGFYIYDKTRVLGRPEKPCAFSLNVWRPEQTPSADAMVMGYWIINDHRFQCWHVGYAASSNTWRLTIRPKAAPLTTITADVPANAGWQRLVVALGSESTSLSCGANVATIDQGTRDASSFFSLGYQAEALRFEHLHAWQRELTATELSTVRTLGCSYPYWTK